MIEPLENHVWLSGEYFNVDYLFDVVAGTVRRRVVLAGLGGTTAGMGRRCAGRFVAVYVAPDCGGLFLQVDKRRLPLDGVTQATHKERLGGMLSLLSVSRPGEPKLVVAQRTVTRALLRRVDPAYDELDESMDDFLADVADIVSSEARRDWILEIKDPDAGPWEAVGS